MHRTETGPFPPSKPPKAARQYSNLVARTGWRGLGLTAMLVISASATLASPPERPRETVLKLVAQIQKADYQGDRAALQHMYADLQPFAAEENWLPAYTTGADLRSGVAPSTASTNPPTPKIWNTI